MATKRQPPAKKKCSACGKELHLKNKFYINKSPLHALDGRDPICKDCIAKFVLNKDGSINEKNFKKMLQQLDKPYYKDNLISAENQFRKENGNVPDDEVQFHGQRILGLYFTKLSSLRQLVNKTYADSERDGFVQKHSTVLDKHEKTKIKKQSNVKEDSNCNIPLNDFQITDDIIEKFGFGYTDIEYKCMLKKYNTLKKSYPIKTDMHEEFLITYVRFKVKEELATARGDVDDAQKWSSIAQGAAEKAKLTPKQLSKTDLNGGIDSFSEINKAIESAIDVIPILPQFKYRPNDACDFIIWCYVNYIRRLQGLPDCEYEDVYKFYDRMKEKYIEQYGDPYGIFDDDPTEDLRDTIKKFITLPNDYDGDN